MTGKSAGQNFHENRAKFDQKSSFNRSARRASAIPLASGRERPQSMEQDVASDGERELKENRSLSLLVKVQKKSWHKKYSYGTVGSMSTVVQDLHGGRHALPAGDTRRSDIDSNVDCESDLKKNRLLLLFVKSEKEFCSQKNTATVQWGLCRSARHTGLTVSAPRWYGGRKDQVQTRQISCSWLTCSYANQR